MKLSGLKKNLGQFSLNVGELSIGKPGVYGLIGANGCGKSTLARLITGLISADEGTIDLEGLNARDITLLSPRPYILDDTVYNNLIYPLKLRNAKIDAALCDDYLGRMGFLDRKKEKARLLSSGEKQKLSFLRALIFRPRLIVVDEALTDLDIDSLDMFENMIVECQKTDPVIWIIISHHLPHIKRICEYIFFMHKGTIAARGAAADILSGSDNPLVNDYLKHESITSDDKGAAL